MDKLTPEQIQQVIDRVVKVFPELTNNPNVVGDFLIEVTPYPFCTLDQAADYAEKLSKEVGGSVKKAIDKVNKDYKDSNNPSKKNRE